MSAPRLWDETGENELRTEPEQPAAEPAKKAKPAKYKPLPDFCKEPDQCGATLPERWTVCDYLADTVAEKEAGQCPADELFRTLRGSLYVLSSAEVVRVAKGLVNLLRANDGCRGTRPDGGSDADLAGDRGAQPAAETSPDAGDLRDAS